MNNFSAISWQVQVTFHEMIMMSTLLDQHALLDISSASSLKQQSAGSHATPLMIASQTVFAH
jgi:Na+/H+ antiporter NhaD/arsenite permease-like protein